MPRCGTDTFINRPVDTAPGGSGSNTVIVETPNGAIKITGARIVKVQRGEWHPIELRGSEIWMAIDSHLPYPTMDLVMRWDPAGQVTWADGGTSPPPTQTAFLPGSATVDVAALDGLQKQLGLSANAMGVYTSIRDAAIVTGGSPTWVSYSCFIGDKNLSPGSEYGKALPEAVMIKRDGTHVKGGWVFATPPTTPDTNTSPHWITLSTTRFAIIGAPFGALFGSGREFYYECGLEDDAALLNQIRAEFGFPANAGTCGYIKVFADTDDFLIKIEPQ